MEGKIDSEAVKLEVEETSEGEKEQNLSLETSAPVSGKSDGDVNGVSSKEPLAMDMEGAKEGTEKSSGDLLGKKVGQNNVGDGLMMNLSANRLASL